MYIPLYDQYNKAGIPEIRGLCRFISYYWCLSLYLLIIRSLGGFQLIEFSFHTLLTGLHAIYGLNLPVCNLPLHQVTRRTLNSQSF
jgi:hypothetical protein